MPATRTDPSVDGFASNLRLLGGFSLQVDGDPIAIPESCRRLLALLAVHGGRQSRTIVAASLWPERSDERAFANLRSSLWRVPRAGQSSLVDVSGHDLAISPRVSVDIDQAERLGWSLVRDRKASVDGHERSLFFEELLPGWYEDWVIIARERLNQLRLHFLDALATMLIDTDQLADALDVALRLVALDPLRERSQRTLLSVYRAEGSRGQAVRQLKAYRQLMRETFDCEPSAEFVQLALGSLQTFEGDSCVPRNDTTATVRST